MKTFWKALVIIAAIFAITGCPNGDDNPGDELVPIGAITVKNGDTVLSAGNPLVINVGQTVSLTATAEGAENFSLSNSNYYNRSGLTLTGVSATPAEGISVTVSATNDSGVSASASFNLKILPKLTGFSVKWENTALDETTQIAPFGLAPNTDYPLSIATTPADAENKFEWVSSDSTQLTITDNPLQPGGKLIKALVDVDISAPVTVTVTPAQAGLSAGDVDPQVIYFIANSSYALPVNSLDIQQDGTNIPTIITVKRGRSITVVAVPDVANGTSVDWEFSGSVVAKTGDGFTATFTATEDDAGGTVSITAKARNMFNTVAATETFTIQVPARGGLLFEWIADENPDEGNLAGDAIRNYPGFRDVWITSRGGITTFNPAEITGMIAGAHPLNITSSTNTAVTNPRLVIGTALNAEGTGPLLTGNTAATDTGVGTLDLSKPVRLTLEFADYNLTGSYIRLFVNNNSNSSGNTNIIVNSNNAAQIKSWNSGSPSEFIAQSTMTDQKSGVYTCIINFANTDMYYRNPEAITNGPTPLTHPELKKAFICLMFQNSNPNWLNLTGIRIEQVTVADIGIGQEADFAGFPTETFNLPAAESSKVITLNGAGYTSADWYIDGDKVATGISYTVTKGSLAAGEHSLTAIVSVGGHLYSKTVKFTVAE